MTPINVVSLFDGMSSGMIALERAGIPVKAYYASEIDKYAIQVSKANYPRIIRLGDVRDVDSLFLPTVDLLIGGSPCQGFSFAGKQLNFDDPRSKLFFEYVRIYEQLKADNPKIKFLLENVKMKKESQDIITKYLGVEPIEINSALVSAQNRKRLYWTNIEGVTQPADRGIMLKDVLQTGEILKYYKVNNTPSRDTMWYGGKCKNITNENKSSCLVTKSDRWNNAGLIAFEDYCRFLTPVESERLQTVPDSYTVSVCDTERIRMLGNGWTIDVISHILQNLKP